MCADDYPVGVSTANDELQQAVQLSWRCLGSVVLALSQKGDKTPVFVLLGGVLAKQRAAAPRCGPYNH